MKRPPSLNRYARLLALSIALCLSAASLVALAAEAQETTEIEVVANGKTEKVTIEDLKPGETRQLYSEAGTLVTATRTAESLELDIAGDRTSIKLVEPGDIDDAGIATLIEAHTGDAAPGEKRIVRIHREIENGTVDTHGEHGAEHRKVIVITGGEGEVHELHGDDAHVVLKHAGEPGSKQVIVKRRLVKPAEGEAK